MPARRLPVIVVVALVAATVALVAAGVLIDTPVRRIEV